MKLLVSPMNVQEAIAAEQGGADIIDVKNPKEGSLGANFPWVIAQIKSSITKPLSATIGDFGFKPGTASLAALGAAVAGAQYIKVGLYDIHTPEQAYELLAGITRAVRTFDAEKTIVASAYSDYSRIGSISPYELPEAAKKADVDVVMVDTGIKDGKSTFEFMSNEELKRFVGLAHDNRLHCAIAGSIKFEDIPAIKNIAPDIIGVRGMVCGGDRTEAIRPELVRKLKAMLG
ncbi:MAG TPA: (5-formylfuran-3-yl)methyl phosphate synthase [Methanocella sp.]|uniref:(5-formylfuran-3-yl)methyl phosphate synthase n=1 Tax=Methanocella sp. TaxID=2052833 RepID=UPI002D1C585A|nr:(5-formylfuran-3-yl)methyl phosphate synthase [Methanocella sp.]HTY90496.1 (5-formylfuran-3-yl)methyl phosphate synthase [Methanocella sp.]